jgi:hypothetical protein
MVGQGVSRSDSEMAQKSCVSGAPTRAAQLLRAEAPGTTSTTMPPASGTPFSSTAGGVHPAWNSTSNVGPAMPYTPASPEEISATFLPCAGALQRFDGAVQLFGHGLADDLLALDAGRPPA